MQPPDIQILCTRLLDNAIIAKAAELHICVDTLPFIDVQPLQSAALQQQLEEISRQTASVVFTSANAVTSVAHYVKEAKNWNIFCTGGKTKEQVIDCFGEETIAASARNASTLAERIIASERIVKVTFFCGDQRLNDLPEKLMNHNIVTDEVVVYTTVQTPVFIEKNYQGILFFSPSAVHSFFSMNTIATDVILFSIGSTTTSAIQSYCTNKVITSEWPGTESLLEVVKDYYNDALY